MYPSSSVCRNTRLHQSLMVTIIAMLNFISDISLEENKEFICSCLRMATEDLNLNVMSCIFPKKERKILTKKPSVSG